MKLYLASWFGNRAMLRPIADTLVERGHSIVSRWALSKDERPDGEEVVEFWDKWAVIDVEDLEACEVLVLCTFGCNESRGGMRFEEGYCYHAKKPIVVVGPRQIIFDRLKDVHYCNTWDECYKVLEILEKIDPRTGIAPLTAW